MAKVVVPSQQAVLERHFNTYFGTLIYAVFADREREDPENAKNYSPYVYQSYANLKKVDATKANVKSRFNIADEVKQCLAFLFDRLVIEISAISLTGSEDYKVTIPQKAVEANEDCYVKFMFDCATEFESKLGSITSQVNDDSKWFSAQLSTRIAKYAADAGIIGAIYARFNAFLRVLAWKIGTIARRTKSTIGLPLFLATLDLLEMNNNLIMIMTSTLREKLPPKPKSTKKKTGGEVTPEVKSTDITPVDGKVLSDIVEVENEDPVMTLTETDFAELTDV